LSLAVVLVGLLSIGSPAAPIAAQTGESKTDLAGLSLSDALLELQSRGLRIVFTSEVVKPQMRVAAEPTATDLRAILTELLEPHGLEARDGPGETLVVARAVPVSGARTRIAGTVRSRSDSSPVAGALVQVLEAGKEAESSSDGRFEIDVEPGTFTLQAGRAGFTVERLDGVTVEAGRTAEVSLLLDPAPILEDELVVTPSRVSLLREDPVPLMQLSRGEILALPHLGDDFFRALTLLPGATSNDVTAEFHVRGSRRDETQILLDGQELYEAYHLKDFDNALSFVASSNLATADLTTGGFPAEFGDRMAGVLDMTTVRPTTTRFRVGLGILNADAGGGGVFGEERGTWLFDLRRGTIDLASRLLGNEDPTFWDAYGKVDYQFGPRQSLRMNLLATGDELTFSETEEDGSKRTDTEYDSGYAWLTHQALLSDRLFFDTAVSGIGIERDRRGVEVDEDVEFAVRDLRRTTVLGLRQNWSLQAGENHLLRLGFALRSFDTDYDYFSESVFDGEIAELRYGGDETVIEFDQRFEEEHNSLYLSDRMRLGDPLTLELGLRYDRHTQTDDAQVAPRVNLAWAPAASSVLRLAWGRFYQSQRTYELQVEDGEAAFQPVEEAEHWVLGFEKTFQQAPGKGLAVRAEIYRREVANPRTRYENLYEALNTFPEVEPDRVRIDPDRAVAEGIELFLRGRPGPKFGWWVNYAYATTEDEIDGVWTPRQFDQRHSVNIDLDYRPGKRWHLNVAWRFHTGWPTTPLDVEIEEDDEGEFEFAPVLGQLNSERLPEYHRMDLRASRQWNIGRGVLGLYVDIQNVYDRDNLAGFDVEIDDDQGVVVFEPEYWAGILPSLGVTYEF
jgi:outer membrane receptor protein involved in Fe transport